MGLFSFFSGNRRSDEQDGADAAPEAAKAPDASAAPAATAPEDDDAGFDTAALVEPDPPKPDAPTVGPPDPDRMAELQGQVVEVLKTVYDPEIPVDIYELGLIYDIIVDAESRVLVKMTLTSPACPAAQHLPSEVRYKVKAIPGVSEAVVEVVWDPPWSKDRMSDAAKLQLGFF